MSAVHLRHYGRRLSVVTRVGTREELVQDAFATDEMFEAIGQQKTKSGYDEFGDRYRIRRMANGRFTVQRSLSNEPLQKFQGWSVEASLLPDIDITDVLVQIAGKGD